MPKEYRFRKTFTYERKRYTVRADTQPDLYLKLANRLRDLEEGKVVVSSNMTVREWTEKCIEQYKTNQKEITQKKYKARMNKCINELIGSRTLKSIKPIDCQMVINEQQGNSKYQINQVYQMLNFIFERAVDNQLIISNPAKRITKPKGTVTSRRSLTETETQHFLKCAAKERRFYAFLLMYYCGCRPSEAVECKGMDIQKIEEHSVLHIRGTKSANSDRLVPIPDEFEFIALNKANKPLDDQSWKRAWKSLKKEMNISMGANYAWDTYTGIDGKVHKKKEIIGAVPLSDDFVPYCLRHSFCTNLQKQDIDIRTAQYLMGHSDIRLTANIYTHADNSTIISAPEKMQGVTGGVTPNRVKSG